MKVFFTLDSLANSGTEKSTLDIVSHFSNDMEVKVISFYPGDALVPAYKKAGIPLHYFDLKGKRSFVEGTKMLVKLIRAEKPDVIVSSIMRANIMSRFAGLITRTPVVGTFVNNSYGEARAQELKNKGQYNKFRVFYWLDKYTSWIPAYWISNATSIAMSNAKALGVSKHKITVIHRGRKVDQFPVRNELPLPPFRFVFLGRLLEGKGVGEMIEAFAEVKKKYKDIRLDIFGEGPFRKKAEALITGHQLSGHVYLHGLVPDGWRQLYNAHCFVFPSWSEGFSGALVEAMLADIPIICSDIPMNLEAVTNETALIFSVKNVKELVGCMDNMILSYPSMQQMAKLGKAEAIKRFDVKVIAHQYESFLRAVITKSVNKNELL